MISCYKKKKCSKTFLNFSIKTANYHDPKTRDPKVSDSLEESLPEQPQSRPSLYCWPVDRSQTPRPKKVWHVGRYSFLNVLQVGTVPPTYVFLQQMWKKGGTARFQIPVTKFTKVLFRFEFFFVLMNLKTFANYRYHGRFHETRQHFCKMCCKLQVPKLQMQTMTSHLDI